MCSQVATLILRLTLAMLSFFVGVASRQTYLFCLSYLSAENLTPEELPGPALGEFIPNIKVPDCGGSTHRATRSILAKVENSVRTREPRWGYIPGVCTCGALIPDQREIILGDWERKGAKGQRESVNVEIYEAGSCEGLAGWLNRSARGEVWHGWRGQKYDLGDGAYLTTPTDGNPKYSLFVRVNNLLVVISGKSLPDVERFARYVLAEIPAS